MKRIIILVGLGFVCCSAGVNAQNVQQATFASPHAYASYSTNPPGYGPTTFRWGWFGADHYAPAPVMHRDYTRGWREWHYRR